MTSPDWIAAALPLLAAGEVEALEWTWDAGGALPDWARELIATFAGAGALYGHSVSYSPMTLGARAEDERALHRAKSDPMIPRCEHTTEHVGMAYCDGFRELAPLPMPMSRTLIARTRDRLAALSEATQKPVGIENLALALSLDDVKQQGELVDRLLDGEGGPLLLDLHNLYCQAVNFDFDPGVLLASYPLERVREVHVAGGKMFRAPNRMWRRDTHDEPVPSALWPLLTEALARCPNAEVVVLERMHDTLTNPSELARDFEVLKATIASASARPHKKHNAPNEPSSSLIDDDEHALTHYQNTLASELAKHAPPENTYAAIRAIAESTPYESYARAMSTDAIAAAVDATGKWHKNARSPFGDELRGTPNIPNDHHD